MSTRNPVQAPNILTYHEILPSSDRDIYKLSPEIFMKHMLLGQQAARLAGRDLRVTFDDGHASHVNQAAPILECLGIRGHFFITTSWTGKKQNFADWSGIQKLVAADHRIGSHSMTHKFLSHCDPSELQNELVSSRKHLEDKTGCVVDSIAMPGGRWNDAVIQACASAGYREVYTSEPGAYQPSTKKDGVVLPEIIGRFSVCSKTPLKTIEEYVSGHSGTIRRLRYAYIARSAMKSMVGDARYQAAWTMLFRAQQN